MKKYVILMTLSILLIMVASPGYAISDSELRQRIDDNIKVGEYGGAAKLLELYLKRKPADYGRSKQLAELYFDREYYSSSLHFYQRAARIKPKIEKQIKKKFKTVPAYLFESNSIREGKRLINFMIGYNCLSKKAAVEIAISAGKKTDSEMCFKYAIELDRSVRTEIAEFYASKNNLKKAYEYDASYKQALLEQRQQRAIDEFNERIRLTSLEYGEPHIDVILDGSRAYELFSESKVGDKFIYYSENEFIAYDERGPNSKGSWTCRSAKKDNYWYQHRKGMLLLAPLK